MPRGKYVNHKGRNRHFTSPEELEEQRRQEEEKRKWRKNKDESSSEEEEEDAKASGSKKRDSDSDDSENSDSDSDSDEGKAKGVENLIEVENPNRVQKKVKKLSTLNAELANAKPELSRREREQIEKQRAQVHYQKLHAAGKTDEARADLARLAIIKQQREEAAKKRELEKKARDLAAQKQKDMTSKALGKRS
ncbi:28 kDa heat- and acid-stable phosphoprotein-like [Trichogramma pretiosum]|uniref:Casein kinase substrate phosphoprotein PP28 domain-containing protein n=1 Tax=Trichogramma kaykai TaxID=54128 RepID=A0ABD2W1W2_9HYME|nr:28 kDa heat- and acid-stable phosphoprotein-like [Trichogramma pretiosum]